MVLFFCTLIISWVLSFMAEKRNKTIFFVVSAVGIGLLAALRGVNVGIDTPGYYDIFNNLDVEWKVSNLEPGFLFVAKQLMLITHDARFVVGFYSFFTVLFILIRLWTLRKNRSYSFMLLVYLCLYFPLSLNIMRQFFAISIVFLSTILLEKKRFVIYLFFILLASLFHLSALFGLLILIVYLIVNEKTKERRKALIISSLVIIPIIIFVGSLVFGRYLSKYMQTSTFNFGLMNVAKLLLVALFLLINFKLIKKSAFSKEIEFVVVVYVFGTVLTSLGYFFAFADRVGLYCMLFEIPFVSFVSMGKNFGKSSLLFKCAYLLICVYTFSLELINNGNGLFPYSLNF